MKIVVMGSLLLLTFALTGCGKKLTWIEQADLQDSRTADIHRSLTIKRTYFEWFQASEYYVSRTEFEVKDPDTNVLVAWSGEGSYQPAMIDFDHGTPYLVLYVSSKFADLKNYGCPQIPFLFFRYGNTKKSWEQISPGELPSRMQKANLLVIPQWQEIQEGRTSYSADVVRANNSHLEQVSLGRFSTQFPRDFAAWKLPSDHKEAEKNPFNGCAAPTSSNAPTQTTSGSPNPEPKQATDTTPLPDIPSLGDLPGVTDSLSPKTGQSDDVISFPALPSSTDTPQSSALPSPESSRGMHALAISALPTSIDLVTGADIVLVSGYESSRGNPNDNTLTLTVNRPGKRVFLILATYRSVRWEIVTAKDTNVVGIVVSASARERSSIFMERPVPAYSARLGHVYERPSQSSDAFKEKVAHQLKIAPPNIVETAWAFPREIEIKAAR